MTEYDGWKVGDKVIADFSGHSFILTKNKIYTILDISEDGEICVVDGYWYNKMLFRVPTKLELSLG